MKIAIIDIIGIPYDGTTVDTQGLGGSESAVSLISRELSNIGFNVTVFNDCITDHARPGTYDGVTYLPLSALANDHVFDIVISSRTVIPFTDPNEYERLGDNRAFRFREMNLYDRIISKAQVRVLWMHDTFCLGDSLIEELAVANRITNIFTLSDFHLTYVANCDHGRRRNFEVLKNKFFITRNGARNHRAEVDIAAKDPDLFVYNASVTKGMIPLVNHIWPRIKQQIPNARLKIIGGYYRCSTASEPDQQEKDWRVMAADPALANLGVEFTGVIVQREIANILTSASFMIYPCAFPETFGISTLESLMYNTPSITCKFGALEEIALDGACYQINYAVEPNSLFQDINTSQQVDKFVATTVNAHANKYLHQQKQYYCNIIKDIAGWDSVALQWKQHFVKELGSYLSREDYRAVSKINHRVHKIFGRRFHNTIEMENYKSGNEQPIIVVSPFYNCAKYIVRCIDSVASQDYDNYVHVLIDDCSTDNSSHVVQAKIESLPRELQGKFMLIVNTENRGAPRNQIDTIRRVANDNTIVMLLDGDDSLVNDNSIFARYNTVYDGSTEFTYGSCWSMADSIPLISQPYPNSIKQTRSYRQHHFNWILPYTHLRTFKKHLINNIDDNMFKDEQGNWYKAGGDGSVFYALIEAADPNKVKCLQDVVYNYNDVNPINDYKVNAIEQNQTAHAIVNKMTQPKKKILIAIPTARNIEPETFKSIYDLEVPDGYETTFQFFYGYNIDQVRNLIADWVVNGFDYLFSVDSDIAFAPDTLSRLLAHDRDVVSGLYIQRKPGLHILEIYESNGHGGVSNIPFEYLTGRGLVEIAGCGFGCALIKAHVLRDIGYPQFKYHSAVNHANTISEDIDFCRKTLEHGFKIWADTTVHCNHIGSTTFSVDNSMQPQKKSNHGGTAPTRAYILRTSDPRSIAYSLDCAASCDRVGMPYEFFPGFEDIGQDQLWSQLRMNITVRHSMLDGAARATASHYMMWKKIVERKECAIILEHDSIMLHPIKIDVPDNKIVALGYKYHNYQDYDYQAAGAPDQIVDIGRHSGAHAYALTWRTAETLLSEVESRGVLNAIDNFYFMRINAPEDTATTVPLAMMMPTPVICWLRESTIWPGSPSTLNYDVLESFGRFLK